MERRMKTKCIQLLAALLISGSSFSQAPFITAWANGLGGYPVSTASVYCKGKGTAIFKNITSGYADTIPILGGIADTNIILNFMGGVDDIYLLEIYPDTAASNPVHLFSTIGSYMPYPQGIIRVEQWGDIEWSTLKDMFRNAENLTITATDTPNISHVTDFSNAFNSVPYVNIPMSTWNVSQVTNMRGLFSNATFFNQDLSSWDVSNVTDMSNMFSNCQFFDQDLSNWDVSNVEDMSYMFYGASSMNNLIPINGTTVKEGNNEKANGIGGWDVSKVQNMQGMFAGATNFNQSIGGWDVSKVNNMQEMFLGATNFNQDIGGWDVSKVTDMSYMFTQATNFNQGIGGWDVSKVKYMYGMFQNATNFNQDISGWDVSKVESMQDIFVNAINFNQDLGGWDVSKLGFTYNNMNDISFSFSGMDCNNYGATLKGWATNPAITNSVKVRAVGRYFSSANAVYRQDLIDNKYWSIQGDYIDNNCTSLGINEISNSNYNIYPNPAVSTIFIDGLNGNETIVVTDITGRTVITSKNNEINIDQLSAGIYTVIIQSTNGAAYTERIVIE
ncbi:MAG: BspA family leucine-rich repeat surface protein [Crocinitomicaceae bacterium]|nr:BspA family leucine-rich repeat surface protein [Crocinitomicaceae bacterium]